MAETEGPLEINRSDGVHLRRLPSERHHRGRRHHGRPRDHPQRRDWSSHLVRFPGRLFGGGSVKF